MNTTMRKILGIVKSQIVPVSAFVLLLFGGNVDTGGALLADIIDCGFSEANISVSGAGDSSTSPLMQSAGDWTVRASNCNCWGSGSESATLQNGIATVTANASIGGSTGQIDITDTETAIITGNINVPSGAVVSFDCTVPPPVGNPVEDGVFAAVYFDGEVVSINDGNLHTISIQPSTPGPHQLELFVDAVAWNAYGPSGHAAAATLTDFRITTVPEASVSTLMCSALPLLAGVVYIRRRRAKA